MKLFKEKNLGELIKVEQMICTGVNSDGKEMSNKMIIQSISGIRKKVDAKDYARVVLLYLSCYEVSLKDQNNLISSISEPTL